MATINNFRNAYALAQLGLYETMELVKWNGGDKFYVDVDEDRFCVLTKGDKSTIKLSMDVIRSNRLDSLNWEVYNDDDE